MTIYSTNKLPNINYDFLIKALIYKQLNQPIFRIHKFNSNSYLGSVLSKGIHLTFNVKELGEIRQYYIYDIKNKIVKYRNYYLSEKEKERIKIMKQNKKKKFVKRNLHK
jgi:hypothetical protein